MDACDSQPESRTGGVGFEGANVGDVSIGQTAQQIINISVEGNVAAQGALDRFLNGLTTLRELVALSPAVRDTIVTFNDRFSLARAQVRELINLKELHDLLHGLQYRDLRLLLRDLPRFPADEHVGPSIEQGEWQLRDAAQTITMMVEAQAFTSGEVAWSAQLVQSADQIRLGIETSNQSVVSHAVRRVRSVTGNRLSSINTSLYNKAANLRPDDLAQYLGRLQQRLATLDVSEGDLARVAAGIAGLTELLRHLSALIIVHNAWQELENELRRIEDSLRTGSDDLIFSWPDIRLQALQLAGGDERWAVDLRTRIERLDQALASGAVGGLPELYDRFQSDAGRRFHQIDLGLKQMCNRLDSFHEPLNALQAALQY